MISFLQLANDHHLLLHQFSTHLRQNVIINRLALKPHGNYLNVCKLSSTAQFSLRISEDAHSKLQTTIAACTQRSLSSGSTVCRCCFFVVFAAARSLFCNCPKWPPWSWKLSLPAIIMNNGTSSGRQRARRVKLVESSLLDVDLHDVLFQIEVFFLVVR